MVQCVWCGQSPQNENLRAKYIMADHVLSPFLAYYVVASAVWASRDYESHS